MSDLEYRTYLDRIRQVCSIEGLTKMSTQVKASPKYDQNQPVEFSGITLMSPTAAQDHIAHDFYSSLENIQSHIVSQHASLLISVPADTFHITGADLIAGPIFDQQILRYGSRKGYLNQIQSELDQLKATYPETFSCHSIGHHRWQYYGLALFETALVALLTPIQQVSYYALKNIRDVIYDHQVIQQLGVVKPLPFMAHITLAYFTQSPSHDDLDLLIASITQYQDASQIVQTYHWHTLQMHAFPHMEVYQPLPYHIFSS